MSFRTLTCIGCPMGCGLTVQLNGDNEVTEVSGNSCKKGDEYAHKECTAPARTVTGTVAVDGGTLPVVSVKTLGEVPKEKVLNVATALANIKVSAPISIGDVLAENIAETGISIIATRNVSTC